MLYRYCVVGQWSLLSAYYNEFVDICESGSLSLLNELIRMLLFLCVRRKLMSPIEITCTDNLCDAC